MKVKTHYSIDINGVECELPERPDTDPIHKVLPSGKIIVGFLCLDQGCENPCESCDGVGTIRSLSHRHINRIDHDEAIELLENDPDVVPLSYFEHGLCLWDTKGSLDGMPNFQWDGTSFAGVWIPDDCVRESYTGQYGLTRRQWMIAQAKSACKEYTAWANGECFGHIVVTCDAEGSMIEHDSCWGYIGRDYADERLAEEMTFAAKKASQ